MNPEPGEPQVPNPSSETETGTEPGTLAKAASGAVTGALIGVVADPLTALVGAAACAVLAATGSLKGGE